MNIRTLALACALASAPATAFAAPASVGVSYGDLDLSTPQGMAQLDKRIDRAAKKVCTSHEVMTGTIRSSSVDQACYREALERLKAQLAAIAGSKQRG